MATVGDRMPCGSNTFTAWRVSPLSRLMTSPGDWLVRATDTGTATDIILSALDENMRPVNLTLRYTRLNG